MATTDIRLAGLDLSQPFWGGFTVPNVAQAGYTVQVNSDPTVQKLVYRDGVFIHPSDVQELSIWPEYTHDEQYNLEVGNEDVITVPLSDDTITELGYSVIANLTTLLYHRSGSIRIYRVNAGAPVASAMLDSHAPVDLASGEIDSDIVISSNDAILRHTLNQSAFPVAKITSRVWVKETAI